MRLLWFTVAFMVVGLLTACGQREPTPTATAARTPTPTPTLTPTASGPTGRVRVEYIPPADPLYAELSEEAQKEGFLELFADALNQAYAWPQDLTLSAAECGEANAFYFPTERQIVMCWELLIEALRVLAPLATTEDELAEWASGAYIFFFIHEIGHALIDVLELPTVGREEDAVDQVAALTLLDPEAGQDGLDAIDAAIGFFFVMGSQAEGLQDLAFWDVHSLDLQRAYGMACLAYGYDPTFFAEYVGEFGFLPAERAQGCEREFARISASWETLLQPLRP